jgi:hypothetical protein
MDLSKLSVKELKQILADRQIDFSDCFEKGDLISKINQNGGIQIFNPIMPINHTSTVKTKLKY